MKAIVKKDNCIGCGACTVIADTIFEIGEDGLAEVYEEMKEIIPEEQKENVIDASESCPTNAIEVEE